MPSPLPSLHENRNFRLLWLGQAVSTTGDAFALVAMPLLVLDVTGSVTQMGYVTALACGGQIELGGGNRRGPGEQAPPDDRQRLGAHGALRHPSAGLVVGCAAPLAHLRRRGSREPTRPASRVAPEWWLSSSARPNASSHLTDYSFGHILYLKAMRAEEQELDAGDLNGDGGALYG